MVNNSLSSFLIFLLPNGINDCLMLGLFSGRIYKINGTVFMCN